jgi:hypothetical protein
MAVVTHNHAGSNFGFVEATMLTQSPFSLARRSFVGLTCDNRLAQSVRVASTSDVHEIILTTRRHQIETQHR